MNKFKNIIIPVLFLVLTSAVLCFGFTVTGLIPVIEFPDFIITGKDKPVNVVNTNVVVKSNDEIIEELCFELSSSGERNNKLSSDMIALWLDINKDFSFDNPEDTQSIINRISQDFDYFRNFIPDTFFIRPDTQGIYKGIKDSNGAAFDVLGTVMYYAEELKCDTVLVADESVLFDKNSKFTASELDKYLSDYDFDGVLFSCESLFGKAEFYDTVKLVSDFIKNKHKDVSFGAEILSDSQLQFTDDYSNRVFSEKLCDFGYVDCGFATGDSLYPFYSVANWWNAFAEYYNIPLYCEHRADKVFSDSDKWSDSNEINEQIKALYDSPAFDGSCFYSVSALKNKKYLARDLSIFLNDVAETRQDALNVNTLLLDSVKNSVTFTGTTSAKNANVYCSEKKLDNIEGEFSVSLPLEQSVNVFDFKSNGAQYTYVIENNIDLIASYFPYDSVVLDNDKILHSYAVCPSGSYVYAVIKGNVFAMTVSEAPSDVAVPKGYSYYLCDVSFDNADFDSAELSLFCYNNGKYFTVDCGYVICSGSENFLPAESDKVQRHAISPYTDNGLGKSVLCRVDFENASQIGKANDYDTYHPDTSKLMKGTIDYLEKIDVTPDGYLVYELKSGINVYGVDCVLINNGYNLPLNNYSLVSFDDSQSDFTCFTFDSDWLSPVTVSLEKQDYKVGYRNFSFNVDTFGASYVDVNFYYSNPMNILSEISFSSDSVFSSYELFTTEENTFILRLHLKKPGCFYGFQLIHNNDSTVTVEFRKRNSNSVAGKSIMLDPGHGGISMVGTAVTDNSVSEASVTLNIAFYVKKYLEDMGASVIMTRTADTSLPLSGRTRLCLQYKPDIFVSIHCDGADAKTESGTHTFYYTPFSQPLAVNIHNNLVKIYREKIYSENDENYENIDKKIKYYPFYVTRVDNCPSVLVETGFMTNLTEGNILINPVNQQLIAQGIAQGIVDYFYYS